MIQKIKSGTSLLSSPVFTRYGLGVLFSLFLASCGLDGSVTLLPPDTPTGVSVNARDGNNLISWTTVNNAISYNVYWNTASGVNISNGTLISHANNPQTHTGLANGTTYYYIVTSLDANGESAISAEASGAPVAATVAADPLYPDQWHLKNSGQSGAGSTGITGEDINVEPVWAGYKGTGVRIAIVDDGIEIGHEDLASNIAATGMSYNYVTGSSDPTYDPTDIASGHGTTVAGIAAARDLNGLGVRGVAPRANLVGYNMLLDSTASNEADAMTRGATDIHVSSNSWGSPDDADLHPSLFSWRTAIDTGLSTGRHNLGTIYIWAAGNGAFYTDNSNFDGQANYRGVITVAAVNDQGKQASYSEPGANVWISAPGGEYCSSHAITTTDRSGVTGDNPLLGYSDYTDMNYTRCMNGTSAATPAVAGTVALLLEANPLLGWRDVRLILAETARKNDAGDAGWATSTTTPVYHFNQKYGFGVVDAQAAVNKAVAWTNVGPQLTYTSMLVPCNIIYFAS